MLRSVGRALVPAPAALASQFRRLTSGQALATLKLLEKRSTTGDVHACEKALEKIKTAQQQNKITYPDNVKAPSAAMVRKAAQDRDALKEKVKVVAASIKQTRKALDKIGKGNVKTAFGIYVRELRASNPSVDVMKLYTRWQSLQPATRAKYQAKLPKNREERHKKMEASRPTEKASPFKQFASRVLPDIYHQLKQKHPKYPISKLLKEATELLHKQWKQQESKDKKKG
ncbi:hypothetical protein DIPPA_06431 [Diplonema papillatum]|nr:hypothetical protein DIPPA_06431 [Diplonema papillatum]